MIVSLTSSFIQNNLLCPDGQRRIEYVDKGGTGLYVEVRATTPGQGTYYLRYKDANGKTCHRKIGRTIEMSLEEARKRAKRLKAEIFLKLSSGIDSRIDSHVKRTVTTLNQYYESDYLPFIKQRNRSWESADGVYRRYIKPVFGDKRLVDIARKMVIDFHAELKSRGLSGATADHGLKLLRHIYNTAIQNDVVTDNPAARVPLFNEFNEVNNTLNPEQLQSLLSVLKKKNSPVCLIARMLLATACRLSEITTATWSNCDMDKRVLYINSDNSKSKKARFVPLNDYAIEILKQVDTQGKSDFIFINPRTNTRYFSLYKAWNKIRIEAGLPKLRLHDLRHFVASELASNGESIYVISKLLGHANVVTSERYSHVSNLATKRASDNIATVIQNALNKLS